MWIWRSPSKVTATGESDLSRSWRRADPSREPRLRVRDWADARWAPVAGAVHPLSQSSRLATNRWCRRDCRRAPGARFGAPEGPQEALGALGAHVLTAKLLAEGTPPVAISLDRLRELRPVAYHVTSTRNLPSLRAWGRLRSPMELLSGTQFEHLLRRRRERSYELAIEGFTIQLRDQLPLHRGAIEFMDGFTFTELLQDLNSRVFFWPGTVTGPIDYGRTHCRHYSQRGPVAILRCSLEGLVARNGSRELQVCRFNSGAPRRNPVSGRSPRGSQTFLSLDEADFTACSVKELVFLGGATLPTGTELAFDLRGPWEPL